MRGGMVGGACCVAFLALGLVLADVPLTSETHPVDDKVQSEDAITNQNHESPNKLERNEHKSESQHLHSHDNDVTRRTAKNNKEHSPDSLKAEKPLDTNIETEEKTAQRKSFKSGQIQSEGSGKNVLNNLEAKEKSGMPSNEDSGELGRTFVTGTRSRLVHPAEYVPIDDIRDFQCDQELDLHYVRTFEQCLVCVCVKSGLFGLKLKAVCVSCIGCQNPVPPFPTTPRPTPRPTQRPHPTTTISPIQPVCDPLPTNLPFPNPLNPCQICICRQVYTSYGQLEVQIQCDRDPSCIVPPDVTTLAPPPNPPEPQPLPSCQYFPTNVWFPHPSLECVLCKCVPSANGPVQPHIYCVQTPDCYPNPTTLTPYTEKPQPPGPLPGPSPHQSCTPYTPELPFEHPWDSCQMCVCRESRVVGVVNVEVNCYTKPECCIEYATPTALPLPLPVVIDPVCENRPLNIQFTDPSDRCRVCTCEVYGNRIVLSCSIVNSPECGALPVPDNRIVYIEPRCQYQSPNQYFSIDCNNCICEQINDYVLARCVPIPNCVLPVPYSGSSSSANAHAQSGISSQNLWGQGGQFGSGALINAQAQADAQSGINYPPVQGGQFGSGALINAQAQADAQSGINYSPVQGGQFGSGALINAQAQADAQSGINYSPGQGGQFGGGAQSIAQVLAQAQADAQSGVNYPPVQGGQFGSGALINAQAQADAQSGINYSPGQGGQFGGGAQSIAQVLAQAQAAAQAQSEASIQPSFNIFPGYPKGGGDRQQNQIYPYNNYQSGQEGSSAMAQAIANAASSQRIYPTNTPFNGNPQYLNQYGGGGSTADAVATVNSGSNYQGFPHLRDPYPIIPGSLSSADASAHASSQSGPSYLDTYAPYFPGSQAASDAVATVNSGSNYQSFPHLRDPYPIIPGSLSSADASAHASSQSGTSYAPYFPGSQTGGNVMTAEALANAASQIGGQDYYPGSYPGGSSADAHASANAVSGNNNYPFSGGNNYPLNNLKQNYPQPQQSGPLFNNARARGKAKLGKSGNPDDSSEDLVSIDN